MMNTGNITTFKLFFWGGAGFGISIDSFEKGKEIQLNDIYEIEGYGNKFVISVHAGLGIQGEESVTYDGHDRTDPKFDYSLFAITETKLKIQVSVAYLGTHTTVTEIPNDPNLIYELTSPWFFKNMWSYLRKK